MASVIMSVLCGLDIWGQDYHCTCICLESRDEILTKMHNYFNGGYTLHPKSTGITGIMSKRGGTTIRESFIRKNMAGKSHAGLWPKIIPQNLHTTPH